MDGRAFVENEFGDLTDLIISYLYILLIVTLNLLD